MSRALTPRERELWTDRLSFRPDWFLSEVLHWIVSRDLARVAGAVNYGASDLYNAAPHALIETVTRLARRNKMSLEPAPVVALNNAIMRGDVLASAERVTTRPSVRTQVMPADWPYMVFLDYIAGGGGSGTMIADVRHYRVTAYVPQGVRINLQFDRESVVATFRDTMASPVANTVIAAPSTPAKPNKRDAHAMAFNYLRKIVDDDPGGPPSDDWRRESLVGHLMEKFNLTDGGARSVRSRVLDTSTPEVREAWSAAGPPRKPKV